MCLSDKIFSEGREEVEGDEHPGHTSTLKTNQNIQKISEIVCKDVECENDCRHGGY